ncbi:MAG TPA: hypothetical protein VFO40_25535 [Chthoniobacterales bacterium]|nr:hypothetical protein [Chthoniobacterales bacterium]
MVFPPGPGYSELLSREPLFLYLFLAAAVLSLFYRSLQDSPKPGEFPKLARRLLAVILMFLVAGVVDLVHYIHYMALRH